MYNIIYIVIYVILYMIFKSMFAFSSYAIQCNKRHQKNHFLMQDILVIIYS